MPVLRERLKRKNSTGTYDIVHLETSSDVVICSDGKTLETKLRLMQMAIDDKAPIDHGMHIVYGDDVPQANGIADPGEDDTVSRSDHVHPAQKSITGNAATATKLRNYRNIQINLASTASTLFDGTINITPGVMGILTPANGGTGNNTAGGASYDMIMECDELTELSDSDYIAFGDYDANVAKKITIADLKRIFGTPTIVPEPEPDPEPEEPEVKLPTGVSNLTTTGNGSSVTLSWSNPVDDPNYHETVVVKTVDAPATTITDGEEVYRGTDTTVTINDLELDTAYYFSVFTVNPENLYDVPVECTYSYSFPAEPTDWDLITSGSTSTTFTVPETGWFKVYCQSKAGDGGRASVSVFDSNYKTYEACAGYGGGGASSCSSKYKFNKGDTITINITNGTVKCLDMTANAGGTPSGGTASGGNIHNSNGTVGGYGTGQYNGRCTIGIGVNQIKTYNQSGGEGGSPGGGRGGSVVNGVGGSGTAGSAAFYQIYRGNTNIVS